jgi:hypothetical protein
MFAFGPLELDEPRRVLRLNAANWRFSRVFDLLVLLERPSRTARL